MAMLSINDKLRLLTEGYSFEEISTDPVRFVNLVTESSRNYNEISVMLESVNTDLEFMNETSVAYMQESALDTLKDKVRKFIAWIREKIMNIINWIKGKFAKKTEAASALGAKVEAKVKSGEIKEKIAAIKGGNKERYAELRAKYKGSSAPAAEPAASEPEKTDDEPVKDNTPAPTHVELPPKTVLVVNVKANVISGNIPNIGEIGEKVTSIITAAMGNVENFRVALIRGTANAKIANSADATNVLLSLATDNKVTNSTELHKWALGEVQSHELSAEDANTAISIIEKFRKEGGDVFKAYGDMRNLLAKWQDEANSIIDKYKDSTEVRPANISNRVQQMILLIGSGVSLLNKLLDVKADAITDCEVILEKLNVL